MLLLGAGVIILFMMAILLTNQYQPASTRPEIVEAAQGTASPTGKPQFTPPIPDTSQTPSDILNQYFERWNAKDAEGMDACWIPAGRGENQEQYALDMLSHIDNITYTAQPEEAIPPELAATFASAHDMAYLLVDYTIHYNEVGQNEYLQAEARRLAFAFLLIRERPGDGWLIAMQGY